MSEEQREEAIGAAWDFIRPKLVDMNKEKGPAGVWSNGYRSGWDAAARATANQDVLEALRTLLKKHEPYHNSIEHSAARAAIAKATGQQP